MHLGLGGVGVAKSSTKLFGPLGLYESAIGGIEKVYEDKQTTTVNLPAEADH